MASESQPARRHLYVTGIKYFLSDAVIPSNVLTLWNSCRMLTNRPLLLQCCTRHEQSPANWLYELVDIRQWCVVDLP